MVEKDEALLTHNSIRDNILNEYNTCNLQKSSDLGTRESHGALGSSQAHTAFDGWTSRNRHSSFSINAFFLDERNFNPRKSLLNPGSSQPGNFPQEVIFVWRPQTFWRSLSLLPCYGRAEACGENHLTEGFAASVTLFT
ncbi:hypothetical protein E4U45_004926 [Claviceps purpurea]|nr:hypothetical protein E4U45_004926 [Claviceps purpurea]